MFWTQFDWSEGGLEVASVVGYHRGTEPTKFLFRSVAGKEIAGPGASHAGRERFKNLKKKTDINQWALLKVQNHTKEILASHVE